MTTNNGDKTLKVSWYIRGHQNNWNWKLADIEDGEWKYSESADDIVYQTRFPKKHLALMYKGAGPSASLLATIETSLHSWAAKITFAEPASGNGATAQEAIVMDNISDMGMSNRWPVNDKTLNGRELHWEYEHPVQGYRDMNLEDPITKEILGDANDNYLSLRVPQEAIEELVITGTAAQIMLAGLMHNDMTIATEGPEGSAQWRYERPNWWDYESDEDRKERHENGEKESAKRGAAGFELPHLP
ncbi:hypothetical protein BDZ45DRAFT_808210 [Acephala macrosclerotiorum]|nr:hypothetical protein BDZ45DRAFT_808210 [Acephala macrosclerotiorum]